LTTQGKKKAWPREKERTMAREKEKGGKRDKTMVEGTTQWQRGEIDGT
jgi:hypothetical protein